MNSIEVSRSAKELDQIVKDFDKDRARKDLPALSEALKNNKLDIAQALIDNKADVDEYAKKPAPERGMAPIHFAQSAEAVKLLADAGAKIDAPYKDVDRPWGMRGETKLQTLALTGKASDMPVIEALLKAGADGNRPFGKEYDYSKDMASDIAAGGDRIERGDKAMSTRLNLIRESSKPQDELQLSVKQKEDSGYTLIAVGTNFQQLMNEAKRQQDNGVDILINEKDNPTVVHAKSNLHHNADVGRVIQPSTAADGTYIKGSGEGLLASFFAKLPIATEAYYGDKEPRRQADASPAPEAGQGTPKQSTDASKDLPAKLTKETEQSPQTPDTDRKIILNKTDYQLPESIIGSYTVKDGKFKDRATDAVRFEDHGKKLSTKVEERAVIADMMAVAEAKNWRTLEVKGTENFRQIAWLEASARGIEVKGYKPNERDLEQLEQLKRERGLASDSPAMGGAGEKLRNVIEAVTGQERSSPEGGRDTTAKQQEKAAESSSSQDSAPRNSGQGKQAKSTKNAGISGALVEHGPAKYQFDPDEKESYYARLSTPKGEKTIWGKDLERAIRESGAKPGEIVTLERKGSEAVEVDANKRNEKGAVVGTERISAERNDWEVRLNVTRTLSADEQLRVDAAAKILAQRMANYPEKERKQVLDKLVDGLNKGEINLPSPKVSTRSVEKSAPAQSRAQDQEQSYSR